MSPPPQRAPPTPEEALSALVRLYRRHVITAEEGRAAAELITGDPNVAFPPPEQATPAPGEGPAPPPDALRNP